MKKLTVFLLYFIFAAGNVSAQTEMNVTSVDAETYSQYLEKDWKNLIKTGKKARKSGIDFYYLDYRLGIAFYELKKYAAAVKYFEKIYKTNKDDQTLKEYLYFSYLFSGRFGDARLLADSFDRKLKAKLDIESEYSFIHALYFSTKQDINEEYKYTSANSEQVEQINVTGQSWYNLSLEHLAGSRTTVFHGYSHLTINNNIRTADANLPAEYSEQLNQNEYYFSLKYHLGKGLNVSGGIHLLNTSYFAQDPVPVSYGRRMVYPVLYKYSENSFVGSLNISKSFSVFNTTVETSVSNLNGNMQIQPSLSLRIYPFGNNNFFSETKGIYLTEEVGGVYNYYPAIKQSFGIKLFKNSFISPSVTIGELHNFTEYNAFIVNNDLDKTKLRIENYLNLGFAEGRFNLFVNYQYNVKENDFDINGNENSAEYINQTITGGIKWYFRKY